MSPRVRKAALAAHLTFSVGWLGAAVAYLALGIAAVSAENAETVRAAWIGMETIGWSVIVPLALASLLTGLVMSLGTRWGLFRQYWVLFAFLLTALAVGVLLLHMPSVSSTAHVARQASAETLSALGGDLFHSSLGLAVLVVIQVLNVYKPQGMTPYGWRKQNQERRDQRGNRSAPVA
jgi:hypothetical protein